MKKFLEICAAIPAPGTGCHPAILGAANYGIMAELSDSEIFAGIRSAIKTGHRKISDKEITDAIKKARATSTALSTTTTTGEGIGWDDPIPAAFTPSTTRQLQIVRQEYLDDAPITSPGAAWDQAGEIIKYLQAVFRPDEKPCICVDVTETEDGKFYPSGTGSCRKTVAELVAGLEKHRDDIGAVINDTHAKAGAWIVVNPTNGLGRNNDNISRFANTLIESDRLPPSRQLAIIRKLELPCAAIVHSGGKSIHAVVRVDAIDQKEYQERVDYIHQVCKANGLEPDSANRNASRLTRLPGVPRGEQKQFLIDTNFGKKSFQDWKDHIEELQDDLPEIESLFDLMQNPPPLSTPLIETVLRQKHKMLLAGPSKAGKSYLLMQLAIAIASGTKWLDWPCARGPVLYINLEIDKPSFVQRFKDLCKDKPVNWKMLDIWHLRGKSMPMNDLTPKLIRRGREKGYVAIIIDPIYKVITGDENAADEMARFCNYFDQVAESLGCAMIYCHHHSKGDQWQKRSMDRASGSGVFARDPDAIVDMIELDITSKREAVCEKWAMDALIAAMNAHDKHWCKNLSIDAMTHKTVLGLALAALGDTAREISAVAWAAGESASAWRIEGTLREFKAFRPCYIWHRWPAHYVDDTGILSDARAPGEPAKKKERTQKKQDEEETQVNELSLSFETLAKDGKVRVEDLATDCCVSEKTIRRWITKDGRRLGLRVNNGFVGRNENAF